MILHLDVPPSFGLLELLLGGKGRPRRRRRPRELTEIEWSLLEEVVRVIARALGEAWQRISRGGIQGGSAGKRSGAAAWPDPATPLMQIGFALQLGERRAKCGSRRRRVSSKCRLQQRFQKRRTNNAGVEEIQRNLELLEDAGVDIWKLPRRPPHGFQGSNDLKTGQVVKFDYPLSKRLHALVNGTIPMSGQIVSAGRKRAFQVEEASLIYAGLESAGALRQVTKKVERSVQVLAGLFAVHPTDGSLRRFRATARRVPVRNSPGARYERLQPGPTRTGRGIHRRCSTLPATTSRNAWRCSEVGSHYSCGYISGKKGACIA